MSGAKPRRRRIPALLAAPLLLFAAASCRQLLGIDGDAPLVEDDDDAGADGGEHDAGQDAPTASTFTVVHAVPEGETLYGIWGPGPDFFVAVGTSGVSFFSHGGALNRLGGFEKGRDYLAVSGLASDDIYAVGQTASGLGFVDHFDGVGWTSVFDAPVPLFGVWATPDGGGTVIAVGAAGNAYGWHTGAKWEQLFHLPRAANDPVGLDEPRLWAISGRNLDDFSIAAESRLYHYEPDAGVLAYYEVQTQTDTLFRSIWQSPEAETSIYLGSNFLGLSWFSAKGNEQSGYPLTVISRDRSAPATAFENIQGVWGSGERVIGVGDHGRMFVYDTGVATVSELHSPTDEPLGAVWGTSPDDVWAVGRREIILHGSIR